MSRRVPPRRTGPIQRTNTKTTMGNMRPAVMPHKGQRTTKPVNVAPPSMYR